MEEPSAPIGQVNRAEDLQQCGIHRVVEITRRNTHGQGDVERHEARRVDLEIVASQPELLQKAPQLGLERDIDRTSAFPIDGDEHRVPAPGPAPGRRGLLHLGMALRRARVVLLGDGALLRAEGLGGVEPNLIQGLGVDASLGRKRIADADDPRLRGDDVGDRSRAYIAGGAVADPVGGQQTAGRPLAEDAVAEAELGAPVLVHLDDEVVRESIASKQVWLDSPRVVGVAETHRGQGLPRSRGKEHADGPGLCCLVVGRVVGHVSLSKGHLAGARPRGDERLVIQRLGPDRSPMVDQDDVAARDAHVPHELARDDGREAEWKGQRVGIRPGDLGDRDGLVDRLGQKLTAEGVRGQAHVGQAHGVALRGIGIGGLAGPHAEHLLEDQHVTDLKGADVAVKRGPRRALREAALL